ncbi:MAG: peptidoglycan-binding domain-containing protein [Terracidiphilus sp.]
MLSFRATLAFLLSAALAATPSFGARVHRGPTAGHSTRGVHKTAPKSHKSHGQQTIDPERATEIQQALIREHYLSGEASGKWDSTTEAAMQKYQADQGWQTKLMPDSRALKKLGLGPDYSGAINAKTSSFVDPTPANTPPAEQSAGFAAAAGINR